MFRHLDIGDIDPTKLKAKVCIEKLINLIDIEFELISDRNVIYLRNFGDLYFQEIDRPTFICAFIPLYKRVLLNWDSDLGEKAWKYILYLHYKPNVNTYPTLIPFKNGIFNFETNEFSQDTHDMYITSHLSMDYNPDPHCPLFQQAMKDIFPNDLDRTFFLTFLNYTLSGSIERQFGVILTGSGSNGKTVLMEFILQLMGKRATSAKINLLDQEAYRCNLKDKTLCYSSEIGGNYLNQQVMENLKELITERFKSGRRPYMQLEEWQNTTKFICGTNNLPKLQHFEKAFLRRWKLIECPTDFTGREDRTLFKRIYEQEVGDVLSWILQTYQNHELLIVDWKETESIWKLESNNVALFVQECCDPDNIPCSTTSVIYEQYVEFCLENALTPLTRRYFKTQMSKLGHPAYEQNGEYFYKNIILKVSHYPAEMV